MAPSPAAPPSPPRTCLSTSSPSAAAALRSALSTLAGADAPPSWIVYLTDLHGSFPAEPPPMAVIWLVFGQPLALPEAPFGKVLPLPY